MDEQKVVKKQKQLQQLQRKQLQRVKVRQQQVQPTHKEENYLLRVKLLNHQINGCRGPMQGGTADNRAAAPVLRDLGRKEALITAEAPRQSRELAFLLRTRLDSSIRAPSFLSAWRRTICTASQVLLRPSCSPTTCAAPKTAAAATPLHISGGLTLLLSSPARSRGAAAFVSRLCFSMCSRGRSVSVVRTQQTSSALLPQQLHSSTTYLVRPVVGVDGRLQGGQSQWPARPPQTLALPAKSCLWLGGVRHPPRLLPWHSPYFPHRSARSVCSAAGTTQSPLPFLQKRSPFQHFFSPAAAFLFGTMCGGIIVWLTGSSSLVSDALPVDKSSGKDRAEEAEAAAAASEKAAAILLEKKLLSSDIGQPKEQAHTSKKDKGLPTSSRRKYAERGGQRLLRADASSPHYPAAVLPSTEVLLENPAFVSIFSASRRQPIFVAERLRGKNLRSKTKPVLLKALEEPLGVQCGEEEELQKQQVDLTPEEEDEARLQMVRLWGRGRSSSSQQRGESGEKREDLNSGGHQEYQQRQRLTRGEALLLLKEVAQYPGEEDAEVAAENELPLLKGPASREGMRFTQDKRIDQLWSPSTGDYTYSGYSRGHMAAAALHTDSEENLRSTFSLGANIVPQEQSVNAGTWARLEALSRYLTGFYDEVFVVSGPLWLPTDLTEQRPQVYVDPEEPPQKYKQQQSDNVNGNASNAGGAEYKKEGSSDDDAIRKKPSSSTNPVQYTCIQPYKGAKTIYAVSYEALTGTTSPLPHGQLFSRTRSSDHSLRDMLHTGSSENGAKFNRNDRGKTDAVADVQLLEEGLDKCQKMFGRLEGIAAERIASHKAEPAVAAAAAAAEQETDGSKDRRGTVEGGGAGMRHSRRSGGSVSSSDDGIEKQKQVHHEEMTPAEETAVWSMLGNGTRSEEEREEEGEPYPLLPGAAVLRARPKRVIPPLHVQHETIGSRMIGVPTHTYKIILAVRHDATKHYLRAAAADADIDPAAAVIAETAAQQRGEKRRSAQGANNISGQPPRLASTDDVDLPPVILGAFVVPNKHLQLRNVDLRYFRVPVGFLEFSTGLSFQGMVSYAARKILTVAEDLVRAGALPGNRAGVGVAAPAASVPVLGHEEKDGLAQDWPAADPALQVNFPPNAAEKLYSSESRNASSDAAEWQAEHEHWRQQRQVTRQQAGRQQMEMKPSQRQDTEAEEKEQERRAEQKAKNTERSGRSRLFELIAGAAGLITTSRVTPLQQSQEGERVAADSKERSGFRAPVKAEQRKRRDLKGGTLLWIARGDTRAAADREKFLLALDMCAPVAFPRATPPPSQQQQQHKQRGRRSMTPRGSRRQRQNAAKLDNALRSNNGSRRRATGGRPRRNPLRLCRLDFQRRVPTKYAPAQNQPPPSNPGRRRHRRKTVSEQNQKSWQQEKRGMQLQQQQPPAWRAQQHQQQLKHGQQNHFQRHDEARLWTS